MKHAPLATALVLALAACGNSAAPAASTQAPSDEAPAAGTDTAPPPAGTDYIGGTGDATAAAEPATDEVTTAAGTDAEDTQYFDFSGAALERVRSDGRPATPELRDAARRIVDATGAERGCEAYPETERLFMLDLDGQPGDEALLVYNMQSCTDGGGNYYDRNGYVLRQVDGDWRQVAEFSVGTKLVGDATISALEPGVVVVSPAAGSMVEPQRVEIPAR